MSRLRDLLSRHPVIWPILGIAILGFMLGGLFYLTSPMASAPVETWAEASTEHAVYTFAERWDLGRLVRALDDGVVVSVGGALGAVEVPAGCDPLPVPAPDACITPEATRLLVADGGGAIAGVEAEPYLYAHTQDGQDVLVELAVGPADAVASLRALGYGELLAPQVGDVTTGGALGPFGFTLSPLLVMLLILLVVAVMYRVRGMRGGVGSSGPRGLEGPESHKKAANESEARDAPNRLVRFCDVAGIEEAKAEVAELVEFLREPERFVRLGARMPPGTMLWGPPGTGKTLLARAVAGEAGVPFFSVSGADFVEIYVGVGPKRIRELFRNVRKVGKGVIFIDEIDALAKARGGPNPNEEREATLNQLLAELDGFGSTDTIVVIGATNRVDTLDPALMRPGRFGRRVYIGLPDQAGRKAILGIHAADKPLAAEVDLGELARSTSQMSGAQLADILNEAAINAARRYAFAPTPADIPVFEMITLEDVRLARMKVMAGTSRQRSMDDRERSIIAIHEMGHAYTGWKLGTKRRVSEISLFAHGEALGITFYEQQDHDLPSERDLRDMLVSALAGRAAEEVFFLDVTPGASSDFQQASAIAHDMVRRYGMGVDPRQHGGDLGVSGRGDLGFLVSDQQGRLPQGIEDAATRAARALLDEAYQEARHIILAGIDGFWAAATALFEAERMSGGELAAMLASDPVAPEVEIRPEDAHPRSWTELRLMPAAIEGATLPETPPGAEPPLVPAEHEDRPPAITRPPRGRGRLRGGLAGALALGLGFVDRRPALRRRAAGVARMRGPR